MLCVIRIVGDAVAVHHNLHERQIFSGHAPNQGTEQRLPCIFLRTKQQFFEFIILIAIIFPADKSPGFREQYIVSPAGNF